MANPSAEESAPVGPPRELVAALMQSAVYRRHVTDQMMWQVPALSVTAQSFLLTIAYGSGGRVGRVVAACLAAIAAVAAVQLLLKHRYNEETASHALEKLERDYLEWPYGLPVLDARPSEVQAWAWPSGAHDWENTVHKKWSVSVARKARRAAAKPRSYLVWTYTLLLFAVADAVSAVIIGASG